MGTVIILYILYPNLIERIAEVVQCRDFDWGNGETRRYLIADYRIDCDGDVYAQYSVIAFIFIFVYGFGIPIGMMVAVKVCLCARSPAPRASAPRRCPEFVLVFVR